MKTIFLLRKPLEGNLVRNTLTHGCGGLNIDAARIPHDENGPFLPYREYIPNHKNKVYGSGLGGGAWNKHPKGKWPTNLIDLRGGE